MNNYDDKNYTHYASNHPKKTGIAYFDKHVQPSGDGCVGQILTNVSILIFSPNSMEIGKFKAYGDILAKAMELAILNLLYLI